MLMLMGGIMRVGFDRSRRLRLNWAFSVSIAAVTLITANTALAGQIAERRLGMQSGHNSIQMHAALASVTEGDPKLGAVFQPRADWRGGPLGRLFTNATAFRIVTRPAAEGRAIVLEAPYAIGLKQLYGGWSSAGLLGALGEDALTISVGREVVHDPTGSIGWETNPFGCDAYCWMQRQPTEFHTTTMTLRVGPGHGRLFILRPREGDVTASMAGAETKLSIERFSVAAGLVSRRPDDAELGPARHGFVKLGYDFSGALPWSPTLAVGYHFLDASRAGVAGGDPTLPPLLRTIDACGDCLPSISGGPAGDLRLVFRPRDHLEVEIFYLRTFSKEVEHDLELSVSHALMEGVSWRVGGSLSMSEPPDQPFAAVGHLEAAVSLSF
jgi:hypothetical protein